MITVSMLAVEAPKVVLTAEDREPAHIALERLLAAQAQYMQLQQDLQRLKSLYDAEINKLRAKCGGDLTPDGSSCKEKENSK
jgi:hypothetical protein